MHIIIIILFVLLLLFGPQFWVKYTFKKHSKPRPDFPGNGGEFATHLAKACKLDKVRVKETKEGDHYNPETREVALSPENYSGQTLTAVVVAAHEIGHAIQHEQNYSPLTWRSRLIGIASFSEKAGMAMLVVGPLLATITSSPILFRVVIIAVILSFIGSIVVHLVTLPVEFNASFGRALPILKEGGYIDERDYRAAHTLLMAAALTYVSASLWSILNFARWIAILRR